MENNEFKDKFKKRLYRFILDLVKIVDSLSQKDTLSKVISNQLLRSGTSVLANFVEAQSASSKKDFVNFINHSLKSSNESKMWVALLRDTKRIKNNKANLLLGELDEISKIIAKIIISSKNNL